MAEDQMRGMMTLSRQLIVERDITNLLIALAAANGWNVKEALLTARNQLGTAEGNDPMLIATYQARLTTALAAAGHKDS